MKWQFWIIFVIGLAIVLALPPLLLPSELALIIDSAIGGVVSVGVMSYLLVRWADRLQQREDAAQQKKSSSPNL